MQWKPVVLGGAVLALVCASLAQAQPPKSTKQDVDEFLDQVMRVPPNRQWLGDGGFAPAPGATARLMTGVRVAGDVFAEIDVVPNRTARLTEAVRLTDPVAGELSLPAGAPMAAVNGLMFVAQGGQIMPGVKGYTKGPLEWCALPEGQAAVCMTYAGKGMVEYQMRGPGGGTWKGPMPKFVEEKVAISAPLTRKYAVVQARADGVVFAKRVASGGQALESQGPFGPGPYDQGVEDTRDMPGLRFFFRRGARDDEVIVEGP